MIIDSHVHLKHGDAQKTEYSAETIVSTMDAVGIDKSVVFAMSTSTRRSIEMAKEAVEKFPSRLIPYLYALPSYERVVLDEMDEAISKFGFSGIKIHVGECTLAEYVTDSVIEFAGKRDIPCLIDCAGRYREVERMVNKFPKSNIIIAHFGRYLCEDESLINCFISLAETYDNVYLDSSGVVIPRKIEEAIERIGSDRVIFGTDGPHKAPDTVGFAHKELDKIYKLNLRQDDKDAVLGGTIAKLLKI